MEKLYEHVAKGPQPWTVLKQILERWSGLGSRFQADDHSQSHPNSTARVFLEMALPGFVVNDDLVSDAKRFLQKQVYDAHSKDFEGMEPTGDSIINQLGLLDILSVPRFKHQDLARKGAILSELVDDFINKKAEQEKPNFGTDAPKP